MASRECLVYVFVSSSMFRLFSTQLGNNLGGFELENMGLLVQGVRRFIGGCICNDLFAVRNFADVLGGSKDGLQLQSRKDAVQNSKLIFISAS